MHIHEKNRFLYMKNNGRNKNKEQPVNVWNHSVFARCSFLDYVIMGLLFFAVTGMLILNQIGKDKEDCLCCTLISEEIVLQHKEEVESLPLYARGAVLMDVDSGRILYQKNSQETMPMASTTKIMTCILALENCGLDEEVHISKEAASQPPVKANLRLGESYRLGDLLLIMMLESYNDSAYAVAEHVGGTIENFRKMMNEKAKLLGMEHSYFITPNGLDAEDEKGTHSSTAYDMALLGRYAISNDTFLQIIAQENAVISDLEGKRTISAVNRDSFLKQMEGSLGIKTGFTNGAGYCFVGALKQNETCLVSVVLGSGWPPSKQYKWKDTRSLMEFGIENYDYKTFEYQLQPKCSLIENISDKNSELLNDSELEAANSSKRCLVSRYDEVIEKCVYVSEKESAVASGELLGYRMLYINGTLAEKEELRSANDMNKLSEEAKLISIYGMFLL